MNTNQYFSFHRMTMVMKRDFFEDWKCNLFALIGMYAAFAIEMLVAMWRNSMLGYAYVEYQTTISLFFFSFLMLISAIYSASIMKPMKTIEGRISYLMLPATMMEKFAARFLLVTVGVFVAALVSFVLADVTRLIVAYVFALPEMFRQVIVFDIWSHLLAESDATTVFNLLIEEQRYSAQLAQLCIYAILLWNQSLFIMGGCYWQKHSFLKVVCAVVAGWLFLFVLLVQLIQSLGLEGFILWIETNFTFLTIDRWNIIGCCFFGFFTLLNWWFAYRLFTRSQVVKPKFHLL